MPVGNPDKLNKVKFVKLEGDLLSVARVPGSDRLFVGSYDGQIYDVDLAAESPEPVVMKGHVSYVSSLALAGGHLLSAGSDHQLIWWDTNQHQRIRSLQAHTKWVRKLAVHPDGNMVASVGDDMACRLWDGKSGELIRELIGHEPVTPQNFRSKLFACTFSADGQHLATADQVGHVVVWETSSGKQVATLEAPKFYEWDTTAEAFNDHSYGGVRALAFSPDGTYLAVAGILNTDAAITNGQALLQVFQWRQSRQTHEFKGGGNFFYENVQFHHEGKWLVATPGAGNAVNVNFFDLEGNQLIKKIDAARIYDMTLSEDSKALYAVSNGQAVKYEIA